MDKELRAFDVLSEENKQSQLVLTKSELKKKYSKGYEIVFFLEDDEPKDKIAKQQAVLKLAKDTGGLVFTGIHSETDWTKTRWWDCGWHLFNRTGEYAVVIAMEHLPTAVTSPASLKRYALVVHRVRTGKKTRALSGIQGLRG